MKTKHELIEVEDEINRESANWKGKKSVET